MAVHGVHGKGWMLIFQSADRNPEAQASRVPNTARTKAPKRTQPRSEAARNYIVTPRVFNLSAHIRLPRVFVNHLCPPPSTLRQLGHHVPPSPYDSDTLAAHSRQSKFREKIADGSGGN